MNVTERVAELRKLMAEKNIDAYIVPSADFHQSEYVGEYFKARRYISGFTGSAGTVVITQSDAGLWTDGRYFIQAEAQLKGSPVRLFKMNEEGYPTVEEYLAAEVPAGGTVGFDGRVIPVVEGKALEKAFAEKNIQIHDSEDLIDLIWEGRPAMSEEKAFLLDVKYAGESFESKLERIRGVMRENGASIHVIATLDEVAWLFNIRGNDVVYTPVILGYAAVTMDKVYLFMDEKKLNGEIKQSFGNVQVEVHSYNEVYEYVKGLPAGETVMVDPERMNYMLYKRIPLQVAKVEAENPAVLMKAMKNDVEIKNTRNAYIKDGIACTKFMYWLKTNVGKTKITEISAADELERLRREQEGFIDLSFETIAGYKEHAAMMHYAATPETDYELKQEGMLLVDSGGHYYEGTTDITRTYVLGELDDELKTHYTTVVRSMIDLSLAKFLYGCRGYNLDILARQPVWDLGLDFKCGTGHGVGYILSVHEGPTGFRWYIVPEKHETHPFEEGMIITDEPGIYIEGSHGIRTENQLLVKKAEKNENGQFMVFENITMSPIDLDGINAELLTKRERDYLNDYHRQVYEVIGPHLTAEERKWLKEYTREV